VEKLDMMRFNTQIYPWSSYSSL